MATKTAEVEEEEQAGAVARHCLAQHPLIATGPGLASIPHIAGTSLTITEILSRLYAHKSIKAVVEYYEDITEAQVMEALSFSVIYIELHGKISSPDVTDQINDTTEKADQTTDRDASRRAEIDTV